MVVPISGNQNYLPIDRGKKITGRESEKVNFEDFLLEKIDPFEESAHSEEENKGSEQAKQKKAGHDSVELTHEMSGNESQGGDVDTQMPHPGRRIDLRA